MLRPTMLCMATTHPGTVPDTTVMASSMARGAPQLNLNLRQRLRLMLRPTTLCMATTHPGTVPDTTVMASSMARGAPQLNLNLRRRLRLMLKLTTLFMATTHPGTVATMAMGLSMARGAQVLSPRPRLMLMLRLTMPFTATIPLDMLPTPTSTCTARGVLNPPLILNLTTATATGLATPTGRTMEATTTANRGVENRNQMLCLAALNKLVFQLKKK